MDSDLTTDAYPNPPRDDPEVILPPPRKEKQATARLEEVDDEGKAHTPPGTPGFPIGGRHRHHFRKTKTKCDKVIYINNSKDVHIGSSMSYTINVGSPQPKEAPVTYHETPKIRKLLASADPVVRDHLIFLSGHVSPSHWKLMARKLGFSDGRIDHFHADHHAHGGTREVIYQCLLEWIQSKPDEATLGKISYVLWTSEEREAVDLFSHYLHPDES